MKAFCRFACAVLMACAVGSILPAWAQGYPNRVVRMVVPYPPGGSIDIVGRILAQKLMESLRQNVVVENRAGAAGTIGSEIVAKAAPDGYTVLMTASVHVISPYILKTVAYDPVADFTPISQIASGPLVITANLNVAAKNVLELIEQAKQTPEKFVFATTGYGAAGHLAIEVLRGLIGREVLLIPYNGAAPALTRMIAGDVHVLIDPVLSSYPFVRRGQLKALAITGRDRMASAPDVPTVVELGLPDLEFYSWYGLWGPRGLPREIVMRLNSEIAKIITMPDVEKRLGDGGFQAKGSTPEQFADYIVRENQKYLRIIREAGIKTQ